ncbi:hypothetical protein OJAV_G00201020, partial [Oryzias javanicus]
RRLLACWVFFSLARRVSGSASSSRLRSSERTCVCAPPVCFDGNSLAGFCRLPVCFRTPAKNRRSLPARSAEEVWRMNPQCARCGKIVYPTEKVSCLDKNWHKGCFHCEVCKMTLNMKNYKGYDKKPYCNAHYPKTSFTIVADTPENLRLRQQSELQSQVSSYKHSQQALLQSSMFYLSAAEMNFLNLPV